MSEEIKLSELEKIEPTKTMLKIHGKKREIKFNFSAWAKLEKQYGGLDNIEKLEKEIEEKPFETIPRLLFIGLLDKTSFTDEKGNSYPEVTEENILDDYTLADLPFISEVFKKALYGSLPTSDNENNEDGSQN